MSADKRPGWLTVWLWYKRYFQVWISHGKGINNECLRTAYAITCLVGFLLIRRYVVYCDLLKRSRIENNCIYFLHCHLKYRNEAEKDTYQTREKKRQIRAGSRASSRRGRQPLVGRPTQYIDKFSKKHCEIKEILVRGGRGGAIGALPPLDPPLQMYY